MCAPLLVLVVIIGLWFGWVVRRARDQREAVAAIERAGGSVQFGANWYNDIILKIRKPWVPAWAVRLLGVEYFDIVDGVDLSKGRVNSQSLLARLSPLPGLLPLETDDTRITNTTLIPLEGLTRLSSLDLDGTEVTDAGLAHLKGLTTLSENSISTGRKLPTPA